MSTSEMRKLQNLEECASTLMIRRLRRRDALSMQSSHSHVAQLLDDGRSGGLALEREHKVVCICFRVPEANKLLLCHAKGIVHGGDSASAESIRSRDEPCAGARTAKARHDGAVSVTRDDCRSG